MRYVKKDLTQIPPSLNSAKALADIEKIAKGEKDLISDRIYKGVYKDSEGKTQSQVRDYLNKYYLAKCAYCESLCKAEIEHYRPKLGVNEDNTHGGYYWLCYEWSNLVPSCRYCNTEGGKGNQFPIINPLKRVMIPTFNSSGIDFQQSNAAKSPLIDEEPYLLHPEIDANPEDYFDFRISDKKDGVEIVGKDQKERGSKTITICNLNRNYLKFARLQTVYYPYKQKINIIFELCENGQLDKSEIGKALAVVFKELESESEKENLQYTLLRKFVMSNVENFKNHFAPYLENPAQQEITIQAFKNYKNGEL